MKLRDKPSASRSSHSHFWDKTSDRIVMCLKQKPKHMCDFFFFFLQASSHIYTLKEKRQVRRYSESSAFGFISKENQKKKKQILRFLR